MNPQKTSPHIAILGGGISGLAAAHRLNELRPSWRISLLESQDRLGGVLGTFRQDGFLIEQSADNFLAGPSAPWAETLCRRIGFSDQLLETDARYRRALVLHRGHLHAVPEGFQLMTPSKALPILRSKLLSTAGKLRLICEPFVSKRVDPSDESLSSFAIRRLGREAFERLVQPLISGIYTADPEKLSMRAALPQFVKMESEYGSLIRAAQANKPSAVKDTGKGSGARYSMFLAPANGMQSLVDYLAARISFQQVRLGSKVDSLVSFPVASDSVRSDRTWEVSTADGQRDNFDGIIIATSAVATASLLKNVDKNLATDLEGIDHASSTVVCLGFRTAEFAKPLTSFGCVIPITEGRRIIALSFSSMKFPNRAPEGWHLIRIFMGGALQPEYARLSDDESIRIAADEAKDILGINGEPKVLRVARWNETMPQYDVGHLDRIARIHHAIKSHPRLEITGNAFAGVGIPQCVRGGESAADRLVESWDGT